MAIYLAEDQVGSDPNLIGFPTLGGCMGIVIVTDTMMYGFHNPPGHNARVPEFSKLYNGQPARRMLSCCRWDKRYDGANQLGTTKFQQWVSEVKELAGLMKYSGPVSGINLSATLTAIGERDSAYCEYGLGSSGNIVIRYSLTSNTQSTDKIDLGTSVRRIAADNSSAVPYKGQVIDSITSTGSFGTSDSKNGVYEFSL